MTLERRLVFDLRSKGSSSSDVLEIVQMMGDPKRFTKPVQLNSRLVKIALSQYDAAEKLKKRGDYVKTDREKLKKLIEEKRDEIENTEENLLSLVIFYKNGINCKDCGSTTDLYYAYIEYLKDTCRIPTSFSKKKKLFYHCNRCGYHLDK